MHPKELICKMGGDFNIAGAAALADLYDSSAINHQVNSLPIEGKDAIKKMFEE